MPRRDRPHILVRGTARPEEYRPHPKVFDRATPPGPPDRRGHGTSLAAEFAQARSVIEERREDIGITVADAEPGLYIQFESQAGFFLALESLENKPKGIVLVAVTQEGDRQKATVFVPDRSVRHFLERFQQYANENTTEGEPRHKALVESIAGLQAATLRALWTDPGDLFPARTESIWWEVWLRRHDGNERERFQTFAQAAGLRVGANSLLFEDRIVVLAQGTADQLGSSIDVLGDLAEIRRAKIAASDFLRLPIEEQANWLRELRARTTAAHPDAPAVTILDTGVNGGHPLLEHSLAAADLHAHDPAWGQNDHDGHGTEMAGLALYGDLTPVLSSTGQVVLGHRLESVKILPPPGFAPNEPRLYGAVMASAVSAVEIAAAARRRTFSMAITSADQRDQGQPTSWSAAIDALAAGRSFDPTTHGLVYIDTPGNQKRRLFIVSAGNIFQLRENYLDTADTEAMEDPAQAWNALTVGGFTNLTTIDTTEPGWAGYSPLAEAGELSPWSTTGVPFGQTWPNKPDVVYEAGNIAKSAGGTLHSEVPSLCVLSTNFVPTTEPFVASWATSAATAQVSQIAARIAAEYPTLWPETIRALLVHSAEWTPRMLAQIRSAPNKQRLLSLIRRYGWGVPSSDRALKDAANALTLVAQEAIHPFADGKMREMHIHALPWPKEVLTALGETRVELQVTLSYFVEPNPSRRGWTKRYRYASHGLRFDVKSPVESLTQFRKRINNKALDEEEGRPDTGDTSGWLLGDRIRSHGSLHADVWSGTAAALASRGYLAVYPVSGWWKDQPRRDRSDLGAQYSLIVSIETEREDVDIWTPVAQQVGIPIQT